MNQVAEIDVVAASREINQNPGVFLLDVREQHEADLCSIEGSVLIPLNHLPLRFEEVPRDRPVIIYCHHGRRSERAAQFLLHQGYENVRSMEGGIEAWAVQIDPGMARY